MAHRWSELAEHIADFFSRDACQWPSARTANRPLRVLFIFEDPSAWYVEPVRQALSTLLSSEYLADQGETLALAQQDQEPYATILFREQRHNETNDLGVAYELSFAPSHDLFGSGWFSLEE